MLANREPVYCATCDCFHLESTANTSKGGARTAHHHPHQRNGNQVAPPLVAHSGNVIAERYKTKLCRSFGEVGSCSYGARCMFAHGAEELRTEDMNIADGILSETAIKVFQRRMRAVRHRAKLQREQADDNERIHHRRTTGDHATTTRYAPLLEDHDALLFGEEPLAVVPNDPRRAPLAVNGVLASPPSVLLSLASRHQDKAEDAVFEERVHYEDSPVDESQTAAGCDAHHEWVPITQIVHSGDAEAWALPDGSCDSNSTTTWRRLPGATSSAAAVNSHQDTSRSSNDSLSSMHAMMIIAAAAPSGGGMPFAAALTEGLDTGAMYVAQSRGMRTPRRRQHDPYAGAAYYQSMCYY